MSGKAPDLRAASILLADPEAFSLKLMREMARDCGVRSVYEATLITDLNLMLETRRPTVAVIDQCFLASIDIARAAHNIGGIDDDGTLPFVLLLGRPTRAVVEQARAHSIRVALCRPFSPRDFWLRLKWVVDRASSRSRANPRFV